MSEWVQMVREFHEKYGAPVAERPGLLPVRRSDMRAGLIDEEASETRGAIYDSEAAVGNEVTASLAEIADGLADLVYVCIGAALEYGIDLDRVFREVHRSNMTKTVGHARADGKIMKGPDFEPPRIREIIEEDMKR